MKHLSLLLLILLIPVSASSETFNIGKTIGDGKKGRAFSKVVQSVSNSPLKTVYVRLRKTKGGSDAYVNMRLRGEGTFENGRRIYLKDNDEREISFNAGGVTPGGKDLVLNAYNGEFHVVDIRVEHSSRQTSSASINTAPTSATNARNETAALARCREAFIRRPRVEVGDVRKSGGVFSGKYRIEGAIAGTCIEEAGYYEKGRLKQAFNVPLTDRFSRQEFSIRVRGGKRGEIRVYTIDGRDDVVSVDELISDLL